MELRKWGGLVALGMIGRELDYLGERRALFAKIPKTFPTEIYYFFLFK